MAAIARETIRRFSARNAGEHLANPWADAAPTSGVRLQPKFARVSGRVLGVALAALLVLPIAEATQPAEAGKKFKTITKTISSNGQIDIPDAGTQGPANPYPTTIDVDAFEKFKRAKIEDVNLTLKGLEHTQASNIDVMLALGNRRAIVMSDTGNPTDVSDLIITLDDDANVDLPVAAVLTGGTFRPTNNGAGDNFPAPAPAANDSVSLSSFKGTRPDGEWRLFVNDDANANDGSLTGGWELEITAKVKEDKKDKKDKKGKKGKDKKDD